MGYSTDFDSPDFTGRIEINPPLNQAEINYLTKFSRTRHMHRELGPFLVYETPFKDPNNEKDVINYNIPPPGQPSLWCNFEPTTDGTAIRSNTIAVMWDLSEKIKEASKWIDYIITRFLMDGAVVQGQDALLHLFKDFQFNHVCNGELILQGKNPNDKWKLVVKNNIVKKIKGKWVWED